MERYANDRTETGKRYLGTDDLATRNQVPAIFGRQYTYVTILLEECMCQNS